MKYLIPLLFLLACGTACNHKPHGSHEHHHGHNHANHHMHQHSHKELIALFESPDRAEWQKPQEVLQFLGNVEGQSIMDLGAGSGYFSIPLAKAGAKVIAADVDSMFLAHINERKISEQLDDSLLTTRLIPYDNPNLSEAEVDRVLIVNTYHHIENRVKYFKKVRKGLKAEGQLIVIDFFERATPNGPPVEMRIPAKTVSTELKEAGFTTFEENRVLLPEQFILIAK